MSLRPADVEKLKEKKDVEGLIKALANDPDALVRLEAAKALGELGAPEALDALIDAFNDADANVCFEAQEALAKLSTGKQSDQSDEDELEYYTFMKTSLGNRMSLEVSTERLCVYCEQLRNVDLLDPGYPKGVGECPYGVHSFDDTCEHWKHNTNVRFWLSKGYMQNNQDGWPRRPWYRLFDDGPDGEKATH